LAAMPSDRENESQKRRERCEQNGNHARIEFQKAFSFEFP
jgi:hypothetical protein